MKSRTLLLLSFLLLGVVCVVAVNISRQDPLPQLRTSRRISAREESSQPRGETSRITSGSNSGTLSEASTKAALSVRHHSAPAAPPRHTDRSLPSPAESIPLSPYQALSNPTPRTARNASPGRSSTLSNDPHEILPLVQPGPIAVDPAAPGSTLTAHGQAISIQAYEPVETGNALTITSLPDSNPMPSKSRGFTLEEELFRARWGWQAYSQIQQTAALISAETN